MAGEMTDPGLRARVERAETFIERVYDLIEEAAVCTGGGNEP